MVVGTALYSLRGVRRRALMRWNLYGLADFVVAVAAGTLSRSGDILHFTSSVPSDSMGSFPFAMIPAFVVPFYIITHLIVFLQVRSYWGDAERIRIGERHTAVANI